MSDEGNTQVPKLPDKRRNPSTCMSEKETFTVLIHRGLKGCFSLEQSLIHPDKHNGQRLFRACYYFKDFAYHLNFISSSQQTSRFCFTGDESSNFSENTQHVLDPDLEPRHSEARAAFWANTLSL